MSEKWLTIRELTKELDNIVSYARLSTELGRAEYTPFVNPDKPLRFFLNPESRKLLYDRLLSSKGIRKRVEIGLSSNNIGEKVHNSTK